MSVQQLVSPMSEKSSFKVQNIRLLKSLLNELKKFGLNPRDWRIERESFNWEGEFGFRNKRDQDFRLNAHYTQLEGRMALEMLKISSL